MIEKLTLALMSLAMLGGAAPAPPEPASLHLTFTGLRSSKGSVRLCVWRDPAGFPDCKKNPNVIIEIVRAAPVVEVDIAGLAPGDYAVSAIHDENDNQKLDKSFVGKPEEGFAFSNDAKIRFGPPKYDKARFSVAGNSTHTMRVRYLW